MKTRLLKDSRKGTIQCRVSKWDLQRSLLRRQRVANRPALAHLDLTRSWVSLVKWWIVTRLVRHWTAKRMQCFFNRLRRTLKVYNSLALTTPAKRIPKSLPLLPVALSANHPTSIIASHPLPMPQGPLLVQTVIAIMFYPTNCSKHTHHKRRDNFLSEASHHQNRHSKVDLITIQHQMWQDNISSSMRGCSVHVPVKARNSSNSHSSAYQIKALVRTLPGKWKIQPSIVHRLVRIMRVIKWFNRPKQACFALQLKLRAFLGSILENNHCLPSVQISDQQNYYTTVLYYKKKICKYRKLHYYL